MNSKKGKLEMAKLGMSDFDISEIVKCSHCKAITTLSKFERHECNLSLKECKTIEVVYFQDVSYKDKKLINGWGTDGILYTFEVVQRKPIPITMPLRTDENLHGDKTDEDFTEPCMTKFISKLRSMCLCPLEKLGETLFQVG